VAETSASGEKVRWLAWIGTPAGNRLPAAEAFNKKTRPEKIRAAPENVWLIF